LSFAAESQGRSRFRSGKGRLAPPSPATPITIGRDVSAVWGIDNDDVKIRYPGEFPDASTIQLTVCGFALKLSTIFREHVIVLVRAQWLSAGDL
jgi:hypothetical protein